MKCFFIVILLSLSLSFISTAQTISLKSFIELNLKQDQKYEQYELEKKKKKFLIDQGLPADALTFNLSHEIGKVAGRTSENVTTTGSLTKEFSETGTSFSLSKTHSVQPNIDENVTEFQIQQSLVKNAFGRDTRLLKDQIKEESNLLVEQTNEDYEVYFLDTMVLYFEYQAAYQKFIVAQSVYKESQSLSKQVKSKLSKRIATQTDYEKSEIELIEAEADLFVKQRDMNIIIAQLKERLGEGYNKVEPQSPDELFAIFKKINVNDIDVRKLREYKVSELNEKISKMEVDLSDRSDDLDLSLIAGYSTEDSVRYSAPVKQDETIIGVSLSVPFGDDQTKANREIAKLDLLKNKLEKKRLENELNRRLEALKEQILYYQKSINLYQRKIKITKNILAAENKRYSYGKIDLDTLIEQKNNYSTARFSYQESLTNYLQLITQWLEFNDQLIGFVSSL